ncbi:MAG: cell division protein SepF [Thermoproteota archaeon]
MSKSSNKQKMYLRSFPLTTINDIEKIKDHVESNNIVILRITPLANKDVKQLKDAVQNLYTFAESINGDIARLGEERVVITPPGVQVWRGL